MRLPHWLRHDWGDWKPYSPHRSMMTALEYDLRRCMRCGRRQIRTS